MLFNLIISFAFNKIFLILTYAKVFRPYQCFKNHVVTIIKITRKQREERKVKKFSRYGVFSPHWYFLDSRPQKKKT